MRFHRLAIGHRKKLHPARQVESVRKPLPVGRSCPGGIYAKEALESLGIFAGVEPKLAQADNVRNALILVSRGEVRFGIVYATDAKADPKVKVIGTFPASSHSPIVYPVALVAASVNPDAALFLAYLTSHAATKIFLEQGFDVLSK